MKKIEMQHFTNTRIIGYRKQLFNFKINIYVKILKKASKKCQSRPRDE